MPTTVSAVTLSGSDIDIFIREKLLPVIEGEDLNMFFAAAMSIIYTNIKPAITDQQLTQIIQDTSAYMLLAVDSIEEPLAPPEGGVVLGALPKAKVN